MAQLGLNITRVSYNRAIDVHTLFIEAEGEEDALARAVERLEEIGYLRGQPEAAVLLVAFRLRDVPGAVTAALELIQQYDFNISYLSSQADGSGFQEFKMGLVVDDRRRFADFLNAAARLCPVRVIDYDKTEKILDNSVFYVSFASELAQRMGLGRDSRTELLVNINRAMQLLDERSEPFHKAFECIRGFADALARNRGENFHPRITGHQFGGDLRLFLHRAPLWQQHLPAPPPGAAAGGGHRLRLLPPGDAAHPGGAGPGFPPRAPGGGDHPRRRGPLRAAGPVPHGVYERAQPPVPGHGADGGGGLPGAESPPRPLQPHLQSPDLLPEPGPGYGPGHRRRAGEGGGASPADRKLVLRGSGLSSSTRGRGGHLPGELVLVERRRRLVFTGDIFINIKELTPEQAAYNKFAPYLMTSVDTDPVLCAAERRAIPEILGPGTWHIFGGHGPEKVLEVE